MRVIVIGAVQFTLEMLKVIQEQEIELVGVVTAESSPGNSDYVDLIPFCKQNNVPCHNTNDVNSDDSIERINSMGGDVIFCLGWSRLIKSKVLNITRGGVIGYHPALLPKNRGRHPLIWALVLGLEQTGSTFFFMDEGADSGDIISQEVINISKVDDAGALYQKIIKSAKRQIIFIIKSLLDGNCRGVSQDDRFANSWRKRGEKDGEIDWRMSAQSIHNLIRSLTKPYVGAHFNVSGKVYKVWSSCLLDISDIDNVEPGKVLSSNESEITIKCGEGAISLLDIDPVPELIGEYI